MTAWKTGNFAEQLKSKKETPAEKGKEAQPPVAPPAGPVVVVAQEAPKLPSPTTPTRGLQPANAGSPSKAQKATPPAPLPPVDVAPEPIASAEPPQPDTKSVSPTISQPCIADPVLPPTTEPEPLVTLPAEFAALVAVTRFSFSGTVKEVVSPSASQSATPQVHVQPRRPPATAGGSATPPPREAAPPMPYANGPPPPVYDAATFNAPTNFFPQTGYGYGGYPAQYIPSSRGRGGAPFQGGLFTGNTYGRGYRGQQNQPPQAYYNPQQQQMSYGRPPFYAQHYPNTRGMRGPNPTAESAAENGTTE